VVGVQMVPVEADGACPAACALKRVTRGARAGNVGGALSGKRRAIADPHAAAERRDMLSLRSALRAVAVAPFETALSRNR